MTSLDLFIFRYPDLPMLFWQEMKSWSSTVHKYDFFDLTYTLTERFLANLQFYQINILSN